MKNYDPNDAWSKKFLNSTDMAFPSEYVIRIFKGKYPELDLSQTDFLNKKIWNITNSIIIIYLIGLVIFLVFSELF